MAAPPKAGQGSEIQIPEWDDAAVSKQSDGLNVHSVPGHSIRATFDSKFDAVLPPHKRYLGLRRKMFLWALLAALLAFLALIIGLATGLSRRSG